MKKSMSVALRLSELRSAINDFPEDGNTEDRDKLTTEYRQQESEYRAAVIAEDSDAGPTRNENDGESSEMRRMLQGFSVGNVVAAVSKQEMTEGRESELQKHLGIGSHSIPLESLRSEHRGAATFSGDEPNTPHPRESSPRFSPRVSRRFAGVMGESVAAGEAIFPIITTGATPGEPAKSAAQGEDTAVIAVETLTPQRIQTSFAYTREDAAVFGSLDGALRTNLRDAIENRFDHYILRKSSDGLLAFGTAPSNPTSATTGAEYLSAMYAGVDGTYANEIGAVRMIVALPFTRIWRPRFPRAGTTAPWTSFRPDRAGSALAATSRPTPTTGRMR